MLVCCPLKSDINVTKLLTGCCQTRGAGISELIHEQQVTRPRAYFHHNPLGRGQLAIFQGASEVLVSGRFEASRGTGSKWTAS